MRALEDQEFRGFVVARGSALVRSAYVLTGDQQLAEDLVQSALEKAARHWGSIRFAGAAESYVRKTMYRDQVSIWRRRRVREDLTDVIPEPRRPESAGDQVEDRLDLAQALSRLGRRQRTILVLRFYEDLTEREVAEMLGISVGTVKSQTSKALRRLRVSCDGLSSGVRPASREVR